MNKRILISLSVIGIVTAVAIGGTIAYFSDVETSTGNIFTAGTIDLKVDHLAQTYNGVDCKTCSVEIKSDTTNMVVATTGGADPVSMPHPAVLVGSNNNGWIHPAWTASIPGASWIWATDPTLQADTVVDVIYTFRNTFEWYGPIEGTSLSFVVGSDNSVEVFLNGVKIAENTIEYGYQQDHVLTIPNLNVQQGTNTLEFKVKNWAMANGTPSTNPGGLLYKLTINGNCENDYFKNHCKLWGETDLTDQKFFNFDDVKPGDWGKNIISLHVLGNDAYSCLLVTNPSDSGTLSQYLKSFVWIDADKDKAYDSDETILYGPNSPLGSLKNMTRIPLTATTTANIGLAWCFGTQSVSTTTGVISCSGVGDQNDAQGDTFTADLTAYAEQQRNNDSFSCANVNLP